MTPPTLEDLEDIKVDVSSSLERKSVGIVNVKNYRKKRNEVEREMQQVEAVNDNDVDGRDIQLQDHFLPGQHKVYVKTWGCGHNNSDGEYMAGLLAESGYEVVLSSDSAKDADVWLLNSCTVKGPSQQTFGNDIQKGLQMGKKVIVSGCVPQGERNGEEWKDLSIIGVQQIDQVVHVVEQTLKGNKVQLLKESKQEVEVQDNLQDSNGNPITIIKKRKTGGASLDLPKIRRNPFIEIIPVNTGCLNQCTYCKTKHARGDLGSYYPEEIIRRVSSVLDEGVLEIWLTSEDIGAYGRDIDTSIVELVWGIIKAMEEHPSSKAMLRIGMTNPPYILEHLDEMCKILNHPRVYSFLHVPVQAGSTRVLDEMRRLYTIEDFERVCDTLLENVPNMTLATDIICGFPNESEQDFDETMRILEKYRFSVLHISQFYPRPGTPAALMKRVSTLVVKNRSRRASTFFESYTSFSHLLGTTQSILVTESSPDGKHFVGHNKSFHQILVLKDKRFMGKWVKVVIVECSKWHMKGKVLMDSLECVENATTASVSVNRIPKLVRDQKRIIVLQDDVQEIVESSSSKTPTQSEDNSNLKSSSDQRQDGSILSLGRKEVDAEQQTQKDAVDSSSALTSFGDFANVPWLEIAGGLATVALIASSAIKPSTKILSISAILGTFFVSSHATSNPFRKLS